MCGEVTRVWILKAELPAWLPEGMSKWLFHEGSPRTIFCSCILLVSSSRPLECARDSVCLLFPWKAATTNTSLGVLLCPGSRVLSPQFLIPCCPKTCRQVVFLMWGLLLITQGNGWEIQWSCKGSEEDSTAWGHWHGVGLFCRELLSGMVATKRAPLAFALWLCHSSAYVMVITFQPLLPVSKDHTPESSSQHLGLKRQNNFCLTGLVTLSK